MNAEKKESLCFSIAGEFVTNTARDWLYAEKRTYENVMEFLLSCMCGTDIPLNQLKEYANDILLGKRKFIGSTIDDSYCMVDDNTNVIEKYPMFFRRRYRKRKPMNRVISKRAKSDIADAMQHSGIGICFNEPKNIKNNYGWLSPNGDFFEVEWGSHESWAREYIDKNYPDTPTGLFEEGYYSGDFLVKKGWLLLHNPYEVRGLPQITNDDISNATKRQKEFLYDFFMERDMPNNAKNVWKGDL